jgi:hypothetical protein
LAISGDPVTRPPISSVNRRKFSSSGDGPITIGNIFAAASAQEEASVVEQPAVFPCAPCPGISEFGFAGGICAREGASEAKKPRSKETRNVERRGIRWLSVPGISARSFRVPITERIIPKEALRWHLVLSFRCI